MHVGPPTNPDKENCDHETVDGDNPDTNHQVGFQIRHDLWEPNHNNAGVKGRHENSDGSDRQDNPLVLQKNPTHNKQYFSRRPKNPEYKLRPRTPDTASSETNSFSPDCYEAERRYLFASIVSWNSQRISETLAGFAWKPESRTRPLSALIQDLS